MQGSDDSSKPVFVLPSWMRISIAVFMFAVTAVTMWTGFVRFDWVPFFCLGLYYLIYVPRQRGEDFGAFINKPRTIAALALLATTMAAAGRGLYILFTK